MRKHSLFVPFVAGSSLFRPRRICGHSRRGKRLRRPAGNAGHGATATWPDKKVPAKDANVVIDRDMNVVIDVTPPALHGLTINGKLSFADNKDLELSTEWIMVHGELEIGTEANPLSHR